MGCGVAVAVGSGTGAGVEEAVVAGVAGSAGGVTPSCGSPVQAAMARASRHNSEEKPARRELFKLGFLAYSLYASSPSTRED